MDVTAYAEQWVRLHEEAQRLAEQLNTNQIAEDSEEGEIGEGEEEAQGNKLETSCSTQVETDLISPHVRTSTSTPGSTETATGLDLTQLEIELMEASSSRTALLEFLPAADPVRETSSASFLQAETDDSSSFCDAPTLPLGENKVRFLDDGTGAEETGDTSSQASGPVLYG